MHVRIINENQAVIFKDGGERYVGGFGGRKRSAKVIIISKL